MDFQNQIHVYHNLNTLQESVVTNDSFAAVSKPSINLACAPSNLVPAVESPR